MLLASNGLTFWQEIGIAFSDIGIIPAILLILGTIFIIVEIFQPGFGFFGICGIILVLAGMAVRLFMSKRGSLIVQFFVMLICVAVVVCVALLIMLRSLKKGKLSRTGLVQKTLAVSEGITGGTEDFSQLLGKVGVSTSVLRPSGNAVIDGKLYSVVSQSALIEKGKDIEVIAVEGVKITVKEYSLAKEATV
ncbi:MAG: hypothetical protein K2O86_01015 [Clostridia bacterium]|nr:hypothetical protein [Clostridia bacterium]